MNIKQAWVFWLSLLFLGVLIAWFNGLTTTADLTRNNVPFEPWQPYLWEYSSFIGTYFLYFAVFWLAHKAPLFNTVWVKYLIVHIMASVIFSLLHVLIMVWIRKLVYFWLGGYYDFGYWATEWLYEYRKDVFTYFTFIILFAAFEYFTQPKNNNTKYDNQESIQIKNKNGVFWLKYVDIITIESGGNYVYFHANDKVYPLRSTMTEMNKLLDSDVFIRTHRSYIVNLSQIQSMKKINPDTIELCLNNGKSVPVSKKYRNAVMTAIQDKT